MESIDPFAGLGKALVRLRKRAGFATQLVASEALNIDKGQLSRWENEVPRVSQREVARRRRDRAALSTLQRTAAPPAGGEMAAAAGCVADLLPSPP